MATKKVSALTELTTTDGAEELLVNDGGTSKKVTIANLLHDESIDSDHYVDGSIDNAHLNDDAVDSDELAAGAVDIAHLSASGTPGSSNFLRGDNSWVTPTDTNTNQLTTFTVSATTDTTPTTISQGDDLLFTAGTGITCETTADGTVTISNSSSSVVSDTSPQLGGDLDCNGSQIQWSQGADVASATALAVLTDGNYFDVTGTTTITSINTTGGIGTLIKLHFDGALTLTHHATDLILPGGANITTAAGDEAEFIEYAAGDYRCTNYSKASGAAVVPGSYTLPEANTTTKGGIELFSDTDQSVAAESVSTTANRTYGLQLNSSGQGVINVPWSDTDTNTTYTAGDFKLDDLGTPDDNTDLDFSTSAHGLVPKGTNTGNFLKDDGTWAAAGSVAGNVIQVINATTVAITTSTSTTFADTNLTATITPSSTSNKILVTVHQSGIGKSEANDNYAQYRLLRGASAICNFEMQAGFTLTSVRNLVGGSGCSYLDSPSTTSATTYKTQFKSSDTGETVVVQANSSTSTITLMEIVV